METMRQELKFFFESTSYTKTICNGRKAFFFLFVLAFFNKDRVWKQNWWNLCTKKFVSNLPSSNRLKIWLKRQPFFAQYKYSMALFVVRWLTKISRWKKKSFKSRRNRTAFKNLLKHLILFRFDSVTVFLNANTFAKKKKKKKKKSEEIMMN